MGAQIAQSYKAIQFAHLFKSTSFAPFTAHRTTSDTYTMRSLFAFSLALLPLLGLAYLVDPPSTAAPDTIEDCTYWHVANETDTCPSISESSYITEAQFTNYVCQYFSKYVI